MVFFRVCVPSEVFRLNSEAHSKSSVFSHDATSIRPNKEVNHGETCVLFSILLSSFSSSSRRTRIRAVYSLMCVLERDFLFFSVSMISRSRAPVLWDVIGLKRTTRETNGFIRSLRADANGSFPVQMSRRISSLAVFFERFTFLTFASSWRSARREFTKRAVEETDPPCGRPLSSRNEI